MTKFTQDYREDILVRMAYHNSALEGNTISLPETVSIILEGTIPGKKSVREFYEIDNHKKTFDYLFHLYEDTVKLSVEVVKDFHSLLLDRLHHEKGQFKTTQNAIVGAEFQTASPEDTPLLMRQWVENTKIQLENSSSPEEFLKILAESHTTFERIHPFSDGNGRTGRMVLMYLSLLAFDMPIVIIQESRAEYIQALASQDIETLSELLNDSLIFEKERIEQFNNKG